MADKIYYACEFTKDINLRIYHSRMELLDYGTINEGAVRGMAEDISPLMKLIVDIPGVECAELYMHKIFVRKSPIFDWGPIDQELHERVLDHIPFACGKEGARPDERRDEPQPDDRAGIIRFPIVG